MFDVGFWELMLIGIMGLVVLGPERLPIAIRTIKGWIGGVRKFSDSVKSEITEELRVHELHSNLKKAEMGDMSNLSPEVAESLKSLKEAAAMVNEPFKRDPADLLKIPENPPRSQTDEVNSGDEMATVNSIEEKPKT